MFALNIFKTVKYAQQGAPGPSMFNAPPPGMLDFSVPPPMNINDPNSMPMLQTRLNSLKEQVIQSEKNLNAQYEVFQIKKKVGRVENCFLVKV